MRRSTAVWLFLGALTPTALRAATPAVTFEEAAVVASGLEPAARVGWFSVAREPGESVSRIVRREAVVADDDGDGTVRFELDAPVPQSSVWFAVDLAGGALTVASPAGRSKRRVCPRGGDVSGRRSRTPVPVLGSGAGGHTNPLLGAGPGRAGRNERDDRAGTGMDARGPLGGALLEAV